ncbi:MAG TPA: fasciclin domain-containing protein, partial [Bacteroidales bacterium]|nr:fasciclin domain-containing protein [Bacteroidales bacterium]
DVSGSYTAFAPSNKAFEEWFAKNPKYNSVEDIPVPELTRLVKYHLVQNSWSKDQLRKLDVYGWIDSLDVNNDEPKGYKRETLLKEDDRKYGVEMEKERTIIVDTLTTNWYREVITDSRKYVPVFYSEYFDIYDLTSSDYEFYFNRPFTGGNDISFANGKIISDGIPAENGFVYIIDQVVEPLKNAYEILDNDSLYNYSNYLNLVNQFPKFEYNEQKTKDQPAAKLGYEVDSLFDLTYPELAFNISNEKTQPPSGTFGLPPNVTVRYQAGMVAPTNDAFDQLINNYINIPGGWGTLEAAPEHIKRIIANSYMSANAIYPSDLQTGFINGEDDLVRVDEADIVQKQYGSNCTFIGLNKPIIPRAFSSITGPVYLQPGYSRSMYAIEKSGLLPALKRKNKNYMLFVESDANLRKDSSLFYNLIDDLFSVYQLSPSASVKYNLSKNDLRTLLLNHVAVDQPKGLARKEFIPNLAGNYLIINNVTGEVSGTDVTTEGFQGTVTAPNFPVKISEGADNGSTYEINNWFSFSSGTIYSKIQNSYPKFYNLMKRAGLVLEGEYRFSFISENEFYTVFVPSDEALNNYDTNSLSIEELRKFLMMHFVQGEMIFTDGNKSPGYYTTCRVDEKSNQFSTVYTQIYVEPGIDVIKIKSKDGSDYEAINESENTNVITGVNVTGTENQVFNKMFNNGVIHEIDKVLIFDEVDTK